jgi:NAD-dependent dihydropyrimidine dehydrogenase PreA subunit
MAYVIAEPCIGTKDSACVDACPVDCIHPKKDESGYSESVQLFIDPVECIDCGVGGVPDEECSSLRALDLGFEVSDRAALGLRGFVLEG